MIIYTKEKYPCGVELETKLVLWDIISLLGLREVEMKYNKEGCPLHGLRCK